MDMTKTIEADSTQINADDLTQTPRVVTVAGVNKGTADQPVNIDLVEFPGRAYRPCKSMRRVLVHAWGADASKYIGRRMAIYNDPEVRWGGQAVGGVRIRALSDIETRLTIALTTTRGKRAPYVVEPLPAAAPTSKGRNTSDATLLSKDQRNELFGRLGEIGLTQSKEDALAWINNVLERPDDKLLTDTASIPVADLPKLYAEIDKAQDGSEQGQLPDEGGE